MHPRIARLTEAVKPAHLDDMMTDLGDPERGLKFPLDFCILEVLLCVEMQHMPLLLGCSLLDIWMHGFKLQITSKSIKSYFTPPKSQPGDHSIMKAKVLYPE